MVRLWKILLHFADFGDVFVQFTGVHPPVVEIIPGHGRMIGEADFLETQFQGASDIFLRLAGRVAAKRRVHVIIRGQ